MGTTLNMGNKQKPRKRHRWWTKAPKKRAPPKSTTKVKSLDKNNDISHISNDNSLEEETFSNNSPVCFIRMYSEET